MNINIKIPKPSSLTEKQKDLLCCLFLIALVLFAFDDVVFRKLNLILAGLDTGVPNRDGLAILFPFFSHFIDSLKEQGAIDPWNPYIWGGTPAIGNPNIPFNLVLFGLFHLSKPAFLVAMNWHLVLEFCAAAAGFFLLSRRLGLSRPLAMISAVLVVTSSSAAWLTNTFCIFFHWAVFPWVLLLLLTLARRKRRFSVLALGALFYYQFTYGQAQMMIYSCFFFLAFILLIAREKFDRRNALIVLGLGYLTGACLALHYLLPEAEYLRHFSSDRQAIDWVETARAYKVPIPYLLHLFVPRLFWKPIPWWPAWTDGWSPWESFNVFIGLFFSIFVLYGFRECLPPWRREPPSLEKRLKVFILAVIALVTTTWGGTLMVALSFGRDIPYSRFTHFLLYPLVFVALREMSRVFSDRREIGKFVIFLMAYLVGLICLSRSFHSVAHRFFELAGKPVSDSHQFLAWQRDNITDVFFDAILSTADLLVLCCFALLCFSRPKLKLTCVAAIVLLGAGDAGVFFNSQRQRGVEPYPYRETLEETTPLVEALRARKNDWGLYRFTTFTGWMEFDSGLAPNLNALYRIPSINGYTSIVTRRNEIEPKYHRGNWGQVLPEGALKLFSIKYLLLGPATPGLAYAKKLTPISEHKGFRLYEYRGAIPRYYFPSRVDLGQPESRIHDQTLAADFDPRSLSFSPLGGLKKRYEVPSGCSPTFELSDRAVAINNPCSSPVFFAFEPTSYPWWRLELDGKRVEPLPLNGTQGMLAISPGTHRLEFRCVPLSWYVGLALSLLFGAIPFLYGLYHLVRRLPLVSARVTAWGSSR